MASLSNLQNEESPMNQSTESLECVLCKITKPRHEFRRKLKDGICISCRRCIGDKLSTRLLVLQPILQLAITKKHYIRLEYSNEGNRTIHESLIPKRVNKHNLQIRDVMFDLRHIVKLQTPDFLVSTEEHEQWTAHRCIDGRPDFESTISWEKCSRCANRGKKFRKKKLCSLHKDGRWLCLKTCTMHKLIRWTFNIQ